MPELSIQAQRAATHFSIEWLMNAFPMEDNANP